MAIYISVVSHGHSSLINDLECLSLLVQDFNVIVKSNKSGDKFEKLSISENFHWIDEKYGCGFGHNNNIIFDYCLTKLGMAMNDIFIVLNPDVIIKPCSIYKLAEDMAGTYAKLSAINLFRDADSTIYDNSIRSFPTLAHFAKSFIGLGNSSILDKNSLIDTSIVDWAAGSFLAFTSDHYEKLGGFDENYFMYCEDIDICYRSYLSGCRVTYFPEIKALHLAKHENRKLFSKHFYWHVTSAFRFLLTKIGLTKPKSCVQRI